MRLFRVHFAFIILHSSFFILHWASVFSSCLFYSFFILSFFILHFVLSLGYDPGMTRAVHSSVVVVIVLSQCCSDWATLFIVAQSFAKMGIVAQCFVILFCLSVTDHQSISHRKAELVIFIIVIVIVTSLLRYFVTSLLRYIAESFLGRYRTVSGLIVIIMLNPHYACR
jgi:hypothetical protein